MIILDTNVLLHNATALTAFEDNEVVLPIDPKSFSRPCDPGTGARRSA